MAGDDTELEHAQYGNPYIQFYALPYMNSNVFASGGVVWDVELSAENIEYATNYLSNILPWKYPGYDPLKIKTLVESQMDDYLAAIAYLAHDDEHALFNGSVAISPITPRTMFSSLGKNAHTSWKINYLLNGWEGIFGTMNNRLTLGLDDVPSSGKVAIFITHLLYTGPCPILKYQYAIQSYTLPVTVPTIRDLCGSGAIRLDIPLMVTFGSAFALEAELERIGSIEIIPLGIQIMDHKYSMNREM